MALVARNQTRLDAFTGELAADGIKAAGFAGDIADRDALPGMIEAITARFGPIDVLEYAPSGLDLLNAATAVRDHQRIAAVRLNDAEALLEAVIAGLGRSLLPCVVADGDSRLLWRFPPRRRIRGSDAEIRGSRRCRRRRSAALSSGRDAGSGSVRRPSRRRI